MFRRVFYVVRTAAQVVWMFCLLCGAGAVFTAAAVVAASAMSLVLIGAMAGGAAVLTYHAIRGGINYVSTPGRLQQG